MTTSGVGGREIALRWGRAKIGCDGCKQRVLAGFELRVDRNKVVTLCGQCVLRPLDEIVAEYAP